MREKERERGYLVFALYLELEGRVWFLLFLRLKERNKLWEKTTAAETRFSSENILMYLLLINNSKDNNK